MITLHFEGWFQCRMATDPDPTDEPHGVSGPTFTVAGEPPFDRLIRLQDPVCPRFPHLDDIGVNVVRVEVDGATAPEHPLLGAAVSLTDAEFLQRNLITVPNAFTVIIDPFDLTIAGNGIVLRRAALWDVTRPELRLDDVFLNQALLAPRLNTIEIQSVIAAEATGLVNYPEVRRQRRDDLRHQLDQTTDPTAKLALVKRIRAIEADAIMAGQRLAAEQFMGMRAGYAFPLNGEALVSDAEGRLGGTVGRSQLWPVEFWLGGYDVDALCAYMRGQLSVPFRA
ncbi:hypothetical protein MLP_36650 [Microlunatus phosphovorus NM-1]|uniref:Uncharacterized protein n=1 Tax=Microlunatus phosphovorus (strain ATCC 700054 / DSM 10555 / JCM 9379 / NBRC 101784 / NCIMB 13414 / VKM Ac-1990 / NM-1) TaxID=1032480 RepID=F5XP39_MICPN|nr:hypothetical protein [Microlunatus phosphovorus]BAK36679.1 hypothetical protein MLP_36650 [Microlunatus phosphovorus NM-1]